MSSNPNAKIEFEKLKKIEEQLKLEVRNGLDLKNDLENELLTSANDDATAVLELSKQKETLKVQRQDVSEQVDQLSQFKSGLEVKIQELKNTLQTAECERKQIKYKPDFDEEEVQRQYFILEQAEFEKEQNSLNLVKTQNDYQNCQDKLSQLQTELNYILDKSKAKNQHIRELTMQVEKDEHEVEDIRVNLESLSLNTECTTGNSLFNEVERNYDDAMKNLLDLVGFYKTAKQEREKIAVQLIKLKQACLFLETSKENAERDFVSCVSRLVSNLKNKKRSSMDNISRKTHSEESDLDKDAPNSLQSLYYMEPMVHKIRKQIEDCELQILKEKEMQLKLNLKQMQCCQKTFKEKTHLLLLQCKNVKLKIQLMTNETNSTS